MRVLLSPAGVSVVDLDDLRRLQVETELTGPATASSLERAGAGHVDGEYAWLSVGYLRTAGAAAGEEWTRGFDTMIDFARGHGWLSTDGRTVRAHVVGSGGGQ
jgi:hypothetical protein